MLKEFIDFVDSVLPNVPQNTKDAAKYAIDQFEKDGECIRYLTLSPLRELSQGDVISNIPFYYKGTDRNKKLRPIEGVWIKMYIMSLLP